MKNFILILFPVLLHNINIQAQVVYDSISLSRCTIENEYFRKNNWPATLQNGEFRNYIKDETTIWKKPAGKSIIQPPVVSLANRIRSNGTEDVSGCFIPRHCINFYRNGAIQRYMLVCFECDGVRFSDDPKKRFIKNLTTRDKQIVELKKLFRDLL